MHILGVVCNFEKENYTMHLNVLPSKFTSGVKWPVKHCHILPEFLSNFRLTQLFAFCNYTSSN